MLEKTEGAINNEQSRDTGNIEHTRHSTKTNKTQKHRMPTVNTWHFIHNLSKSNS